MSKTNDTDLNALRDAIYQDAVAHGLWESADCTVQCIINLGRDEGDTFDPDELMRALAAETICREAGELKMVCGEEAYAEELADVIIEALSVAGKLGIDIDEAVRRDMESRRGWGGWRRRLTDD